jgi:hypothetical protein
MSMPGLANSTGRLLCGAFFVAACFAQSDTVPLPRFGLGVKLSTLGAGIEAATAVTRKSNLRGGFNAFTYGTDLTKDGIGYSGELRLRSVDVLYDQYLVGPLHVSPGVLIYNGNRATATASVPGGQSFSLGGNTFYSSTANPVAGNGTLNLGTVSPMLLFGVGNLLPRNSRHFAVNFEAGVIFQRPPKATLNLAGSTCNSAGTACLPIASNPVVQSSIQSEQTKINNDVNFFKYYPILSLGFGYKF